MYLLTLEGLTWLVATSSAFILLGLYAPQSVRWVQANLATMIKTSWPKHRPLWVQETQTLVNSFAMTVSAPPAWLYPLALIAFAISTFTAIFPPAGIAVASFIVMSYVYPEFVEWIPGVTKENNFFRGVRWWSVLQPPFWVQLLIIVIPSLVLGVELHPLFVVLIGGSLFAATWSPEQLDSLGSWNIARWNKARFTGAVMGLLGLGWALHSFKFESLVLLGIGLYLFGKRLGWFGQAKRAAQKSGLL